MAEKLASEFKREPHHAIAASTRARSVFWWRFLSAFCVSQLLAGGVVHADLVTIPTAGRNVWRLAVGQLDAEKDAYEILGATYDGRLCAFSESGAHLWDYEVGAFVFDVAMADLDGDGVDEVFAAAADGSVRCLTADGAVRWVQKLPAPVYQVAVCESGEDGPKVIAGGVSRELAVYSPHGELLQTLPLGGAVRTLLVGDFDGDTSDDLFVVPLKAVRPREAAVYGGSPLQRLSTARIDKLPFVLRAATDYGVADLDGDGKEELITLKGAVALTPAPKLETGFSPPGLPRPGYDFFYRMPMQVVGRLTPSGETRVVTLNGPDLIVHDVQGKLVDRVRMPFGFCDVAYLPGRGRGDLLFASRPNGDDNLYRLRFDEGWKEDAANASSPGVLASISNNLSRLTSTAADWSGKRLDRGTQRYPIQVSALWVDRPGAERGVLNAIELIHRYEKEFPYENLRFATVLWIDEKGELPRPDGKPWNRDRRLKHQADREFIRRMAHRMESEGACFWVQVGHGCAPHLSVEACREIMQIAPNTCLGFVSAEDEQPKEVEYYFEHHICPLMDLCAETGGGKMFVLREKNTWWASLAATEKVARWVLRDEYRHVLVPSVEDSNSRTPDLNLAGRVGLWKAGRVDRWCSRMVADCFSFNRAWEWEYPMSGHPHLRYLVSHMALGASVFMIKVGQHSTATGELTRVGEEGVAPFLHLLGQGVIAPPTQTEHDGAFCPITLGIETPTDRYLRSGLNGHHYDRFKRTTEKEPFIGRLDNFWGMSPTPSQDIGAVLWGRDRQFGNFIPASPNGFVTLLPLAALGTEAAAKAVSWSTDGDVLRKNGRAFPLDEGVRLLTQEIEQAAQSLPFRVEGDVFYQSVSEGDGRYLVYLVDHGYLDPSAHSVRLIANAPSAWSVIDRVTGDDLGEFQAAVDIEVPAGSLRVLEISRVRD